MCEPDVLDRIESDSTIWEREPLESLALIIKFPLTDTKVFGARWTLFGTKNIWKSCGMKAKQIGKHGESRLLEESASRFDRPYWF